LCGATIAHQLLQVCNLRKNKASIGASMITKDFGTQVEKCLDKAMGDYEPHSCKVACYFHRKRQNKSSRYWEKGAK